jgi:hypothetical protein
MNRHFLHSVPFGQLKEQATFVAFRAEPGLMSRVADVGRVAKGDQLVSDLRARPSTMACEQADPLAVIEEPGAVKCWWHMLCDAGRLAPPWNEITVWSRI